VGSIERRIEDLERRLQGSKSPDPDADLRRAMWAAILDELSSLKSYRAGHYHKLGVASPPPIDPAGEALGYPYTTGQLTAFAVRRVIERDFTPQLEVGEGEVENAVEDWTQGMRTLDERAAGPDSWDKIEAEGPPERKQHRGGC
jgi:hypothetical protein